MRLEIENIGKVKKAYINLNGITVVAGVNSSGKSTIAKAVSCLVNANHKMQSDVKKQKIESLEKWLSAFINDSGVLDDENVDESIEHSYSRYFARIQMIESSFCERMLEFQYQPLSSEQLRSILGEIIGVSKDPIMVSDKQFADLNEILETSDLERQKYVVFKSFREKFDNQIGFIGNIEESFVSLFSDEGIVSLKTVIRNNKVLDFFSGFGNVNSSVFLEAPSRFIFPTSGRRRVNQINTPIWRLVEQDFLDYETFEDFKKNENSLFEIDKFIEEVIHGGFVSDTSLVGFVFRESIGPSSDIEMCNVASGVKVLALIRRLVQNRTLNGNSILVIDEPETGLHPEWQIQFARLLGLLSKKMGIKVLLTTHSPYFLRAIEVVSKDYEMQDSTSFYLMKEESDGFRFSSYDVTNRTEEIYKQLYLPLERL